MQLDLMLISVLGSKLLNLNHCIPTNNLNAVKSYFAEYVSLKLLLEEIVSYSGKLKMSMNF